MKSWLKDNKTGDIAGRPLKPVGLVDPKTGMEPYACLQLRQDDRAKTMYNLVGFQTRLKWPEQKRVFGMIPGLEKTLHKYVQAR